MAPTRSGENGVEKKRSRRPGRPASGAATKRHKSATTQEKKVRKRPSQGKADPELSGTELSQAKRRGRKRGAEAEPDEITEGQPAKDKNAYVQLARKTRRIPQETIDSWPHVSSQVLEQITAVLKTAKNEIANGQRDFRRIGEANDTLNALIQSLARFLSHEKIPPHAKDIHFNVDKLNERHRLVSAEVRAARHSNQLLSEQSRVAQHFLERDEENLEQLKRNAKKWKAEWKHQERHGQVHPLLQDAEDSDVHGDLAGDIRLKQAAMDAHMLDAPDSELAPLLEQLGRSLENLQGNHGQVGGVDEALERARTALDDVLFRHASSQQYDAL